MQVVSLLAPLLFNQTQSEAFKSGLEALLWSQAQKSPERILAGTEGKSWNWGFHEEHDDAVSLTAAQTALTLSSEEPVMTLFPRVCILENPSPLHAGFSLCCVVVAGDLESKEQVDRVNSRNGKENSASGKRRISVSNPIGPSSVQQRTNSLPSSSRSLKESFSGRAIQNQLEISLPEQSGRG